MSVITCIGALGESPTSWSGFPHLLVCHWVAVNRSNCCWIGMFNAFLVGFKTWVEYALEFIRDLTKEHIGEKEYRPWVPFIGTLFLFIFVSNWSGALLPWKLIHLASRWTSCANWWYQHHCSIGIAYVLGLFLCRFSQTWFGLLC